MSTRAAGMIGEARAASHLERVGYRILHRNYRIRGGEIDLVALDGGTLCFVEVRSRARSDYGRAEETISAAKRRRIILAAEHYLAARAAAPGWNGSCRFDVVAIHDDAIQLIRDAFRA